MPSAGLNEKCLTCAHELCPQKTQKGLFWTNVLPNVLPNQYLNVLPNCRKNECHTKKEMTMRKDFVSVVFDRKKTVEKRGEGAVEIYRQDHG